MTTETERVTALIAKARHNLCGVCGSPLAVAQDPATDRRRLKCREGWLDDDAPLRRPKSLTQRYREGEAMNVAIVNRLEKKLGGAYMESQALMKMDENTMLARIERAKFPQALNAEEKRTLAIAAISYGFDPLMGELTIYQGRPFVSIDGRYRKARDTGKLDGVRTRPATKQEREDWSIPEGDFFFLAEVFVKGCSMPFQGWGRIRAAERSDKGAFKPVDTNPQRMAEKRAEAQALRKAFSIPLPSAEDIGFEEEPVFPAPVEIKADCVDAETREISGDAPSPAPQEVKATPAPRQEAAGAESRPPRPAALIQWDQMDFLRGFAFPEKYGDLEGFLKAFHFESLETMTKAQATGAIRMLKGEKA